MKMHRSQGVASCECAAFLAVALSVGALSASARETPDSLQFRFVTFVVPGSPFTAAYGIDDTGLVSGFYYDAGFGAGHGLLWREGDLQTLDAPGYVGETFLGDSSDFGLVIGNAGNPSLLQYAVEYDVRTGDWAFLPPIKDLPQSWGNGMNNAGVAAGEACTVAGVECVGWTWNGRKYTSMFSVPAASPSVGGTNANSINDRGQIVGSYYDASGFSHGFLKDDDDYTNIDLGVGGTSAYGINDAGEIVGNYYDAQGISHGFIGKPGQFATFDYPGSGVIGTNIFGVNARGDIAGWWADASHVVHAFVGYRVSRRSA